MKIARINHAGLEQIAVALGRHHKLGRDHFDPVMIQAWAAEAEDRFANGAGCGFEIRSFDSISGAAIAIDITEDGHTIEEVTDE